MGESSRSDWTWPAIWLVMGAMLPPIVVRALLMVEFDLVPRAGDLRGAGLDVAISLIVGAVVLLAIRHGTGGRAAAQGVMLAWCVVNIVNYQHVLELGSVARLTYLEYAFDPVFLRGSGMAIPHPWIFAVVAIVSSVMVWVSPRPSGWRSAAIVGLTGLVAAAAVAMAPPDRRLSQWRFTNVIIVQFEPVGLAGGDESDPSRDRRRFQADLSGRSTIERPGRATNVLLVILEGVSGAYVPTLRNRHGSTNEVTMPELDAMARRGVAWSTFVNHQRQTNRGEYALLCGDHPRLGGGEPKMTELVGSDRLECLPMMLRDRGYATVYLQAAPMSFMMKDQFMPIAGFDESIGDTYFENAYRRNHWGVDDRAFFEQSVAMLERLEGESDPWFLTLLTVGTHHPFNVPSDFVSGHENGSTGWAMDYLDRAVGAFFRAIDDMGLLEDTLVLITSDESREQRPQQGDVGSMLAQSWGFLIALTPSGTTAVVDEPFMQLDVPISVLDYLGMEKSPGRLGGRSVFRHYDTGREIFWGNAHLHLVGGLSATGDVAVCDWGFERCSGAKIGDGTLYSPDLAWTDVDPATADWLRKGVAATAATARSMTATRDVNLISPGALPLNTEAPVQFVVAGQFLSIPARTRADVEIEMSLTGPRGGSIRFSHDLILGRRQEYLRSTVLEVGQTVIIRYSFLSETAFDEVELRVWAEAVSMSGLEIVTRRADIRLAPAATDDLPFGLTEHEARIVDPPTPTRSSRSQEAGWSPGG